MRRKVIDADLSETTRALYPGGLAVSRHPGRWHLEIPLRRFASRLPRGQRSFNLLPIGKFRISDGWRADVSRPMVRGSARWHGLRVESQIRRWGGRDLFGVLPCHDSIPMFREAG